MMEENDIGGRLNDAVVNGNNPYFWPPSYSPITQDRIVIHPATDACSLTQAAYVREEVFGREWNLRIPPIVTVDGAECLTLIASSRPDLQPVAVVTVVETTQDLALHRRLGLLFPEGARIARYTQLAVLKPYRGLSIPVQLVAEAHRRFVAPQRIEYTWLLFNANRAASSSFCTALGFRPAPGTVNTEYGLSRVLIRNHASAFGGDTNSDAVQPRSTVITWNPDEWIAQ